jgi:hypothetical protein
VFNPQGRVDSMSCHDGYVRVRGWAFDRNTRGPISVHIYENDEGRRSELADEYRPDVGRAYPGSGSHHGFDVEIRDVAPGAHSVCAYGITVGEGGNTLLGCRNATVSATPFGRLDVARMEYGKLRVRGWAIDPDTDNPIQVHIYDNGRGLANLGAANVDRPDVGQRYGRGSRHGFDALLTVAPGNHQIRAYAINAAGGGGNAVIGTRTVAWSGNPFGAFDSVTAVGGGRVRVRGWAIDSETTGPIRVHIYSDGRGVASIAADRPRPDLERLGHGTAHGFDATVTVGAGRHSVCAYAINVGTGANVRLACRTVTAT